MSNLQRAGELAEMIPTLRQARSLLSADGATVTVRKGQEEVLLPRAVTPNIIAIINAELNRATEEVARL